jgi:hypothetical protein
VETILPVVVGVQNYGNVVITAELGISTHIIANQSRAFTHEAGDPKVDVVVIIQNSNGGAFSTGAIVVWIQLRKTINNSALGPHGIIQVPVNLGAPLYVSRVGTSAMPHPPPLVYEAFDFERTANGDVDQRIQLYGNCQACAVANHLQLDR